MLDRRMPVKVGIVCRNLLPSYNNKWLIPFVKYMDPSRVKFTGLALSEFSQEDESISLPLSKFINIYGSPSVDKYGKHDFKNIQRIGESSILGISQVYAASNILLTVGMESTFVEALLNPAYKSKEYGAKIVTVSHSYQPPYKDPRYGKGANYLVASCQEAAQAFSQLYRSKVKIIHNGVDVNSVCPTEPREESRKKIGIQNNEIVIGLLGDREANDIDNAEKAVAKLNENLIKNSSENSYKLLVISDFPDMHLGNILNTIDVALYTSFEPICYDNLILEAMFSSVPIITTNTGVYKDLKEISNYNIAKELSYNDPTSIAHAISDVRTCCYETSTVDPAFNLVWSKMSASYSAARWAEFLEDIMKNNGESNAHE